MYLACRHIKPNGVRCQSPALRGGDFCYFHLKFRNEPYEKFGPMRLPVPEDRSAIQIALAKISEALITDSISTKRASLLLYSLQIATSALRAKPIQPVPSVESVTSTSTGDDLAPELRVCDENDICIACPHAETCPNYNPKKKPKRTAKRRPANRRNEAVKSRGK